MSHHFPDGSDSKESAYNAGDQGSILGQEDLLEKEMATHFSILAWRIREQRSLAGYSPWDHVRDYSTTGSSVLHYLPEFVQIHVH